jgi:hypothetical protein
VRQRFALWISSSLTIDCVAFYLAGVAQTAHYLQLSAELCQIEASGFAADRHPHHNPGSQLEVSGEMVRQLRAYRPRSLVLGGNPAGNGLYGTVAFFKSLLNLGFVPRTEIGQPGG